MNIDQNIKAIEKTNTKVVGILENPFVKYGFLIFIVIRIIFIDRMDSWYLELMNYTSVKIIYALLVAYSACFDPVYAIALATFIIICIQEFYMRNAKKAVITSVGGVNPLSIGSTSVLLDSGVAKVQKLPTNAVIKAQEVVYETIPDKAILVNDENVYNLINKHTLQRVPASNDSLIAEYDYYMDPAYKTLTANVDGKKYLGHNKFYITEDGLMSAQTNQEPNADQNIAVQAFPISLNIQGLPNGFDKGVGGANPELASIYSS
jgi:hypothetical protein